MELSVETKLYAVKIICSFNSCIYLPLKSEYELMSNNHYKNIKNVLIFYLFFQ